MHSKRKYYMDYLRIISFVEVVAIHLSSYLLSNSTGWGNKAFCGIVAFAIPMFTMISGANILERGYSLKEIWHRKVWKLFVAFILTSAGYLFWDFLKSIIFEGEPFSILGEISTFISGRYHMWYLYMICGLYIITPILNSIIAKRELLFYLCGISFVVSFLFPAIEALEIATFSVVIDKVNICMGSGYLFYYLLGYILDHEINIEKVKSSVVFTVALVLTILEIVLGLSGDFSILTGIAAGMWFLFFKIPFRNCVDSRRITIICL